MNTPNTTTLNIITSNDFPKEEIAATALRAKLYRRSGLMRDWLYNPESIKHIVLVGDTKPVAVGMIHVDTTLSLYVQGKYRKQGIATKMIGVLLGMSQGKLIGVPDWDRPYDDNRGFWDKIIERYGRVTL